MTAVETSKDVPTPSPTAVQSALQLSADEASQKSQGLVKLLQRQVRALSRRRRRAARAQKTSREKALGITQQKVVEALKAAKKAELVDESDRVADAVNAAKAAPTQAPSSSSNPVRHVEAASTEHKSAKNVIDSAKLVVHEVGREEPRVQVPRLSYGLERVLFNPGVYHLQDPRSRVFNFDPYLATIMPIDEFDFDALNRYITSSEDAALSERARRLGKKFAGSTSSLTGILSHFHFLLSAWRPINPAHLSRSFDPEYLSFTRITRAPAAVVMHYKDGIYSIDADKQFDAESVLALLGKSMEKLLTLPKHKYEEYRLSNSSRKTRGQDEQRESYHYTTFGNLLMRAQLDAYDRRVPGTGVFDIKTRAVVSIRMHSRDVQKGLGYEIRRRFGQWESFEREYFDMIRSAFLKYSLQVRIGRMDGIFVAFHNVSRIFGFQYISQAEMDLAIHGTESPTLGVREFKLSLALMNMMFEKVTARFPGRSLRVFFETRPTKVPVMYIVAKPITAEDLAETDKANKAEVENLQESLLDLAAKESTRGSSDESLWCRLQGEAKKLLQSDPTSGSEQLRKAIEECLVAGGWVSWDSSQKVSTVVDDLLKAITDAPSLSAVALDAEEDGLNFAADPDDGETLEDGVESNTLDSGSASLDVAESKIAKDAVLSGSTGTESDKFNEPRFRNLVMRLIERVESDFFDDAAPDADELPAVQPVSLREFKRTLLEANEELGLFSRRSEQERWLSQDQDQGDEAPVEPASSASEGSEADDETNGAKGHQAGVSAESGSDSGSAEPFAMALTIRNKVGGKYVERPELLGRGQTWTVEYDIKEYTPEQSARLYRQVSERRRKVLTEARTTDGGGYNRSFYRQLESWTKKGRLFRERESKRFSGEPLVVWDTRREARRNGRQR